MKKDNKTIVITSIIALVILIIALFALNIFNSLINSSENKITVEGIASIDAMPDLMTVYLIIETINDTTIQAKNANNEILDELVLNLARQGFTRDKLKTEQFHIYPNYEYSKGKQTQKGYIASHSLKIELSTKEFDKMGNIIDAIIDSGARINYINFELSQELQNQYKAQALELASKDATIKADAIALGLNQKVGKLVSVSVSDFGYSPWNIYTSRVDSTSQGYDIEDAMIAKEATISIEPGEQKITARVSAIFKLK